ncbi:MAG: tubulin-like doman-containing protein [Anaerolineae bacterium]
MTRHALVIGLGGTGAWVLTYLKKDLIESNGGVMPENVKLLAFDTVTQTGANVTSVQQSSEVKDITVGSVRLKPQDEYIHLGGDTYEIGETVSNGRKTGVQALPHIDSWFEADHWLTSLPRASWSLAAGAGQLRQFGRLGLFTDLRARNKSAIWSRIDVAVANLARQFKGKERLEIIIVGSFAGGTGSGMFIDIALLARHRASSVPNLVRGYFALPRVFDQDPDNDMLARSFAAWRELNRFMVISKDFALPGMVYNSADTQLQLKEIRSRAFDACYLVDGVRAEVRVADEAEFGVHPAIADAISALLDDKAGTAYTEWVVTNLSPEYAARPGVPLYSTVGTHSYKVPVYYDQEIFAHRLSLNLLDRLLAPIRDDPQNPTRITRVSPTDPTNPSRIGRDNSFDLLTKDQTYLNASEKPTQFTARMVKVLNDYSASLVATLAQGSMKGGYTWLGDFTNLGGRDDIKKLVTEVQQEAGLTVVTSFKTSKDLKEPPKDGVRRFKRDISAWYKDHFGGIDAGGQEYGGKFGRALDQCSQIQIDIYRRQVRLWLLDTLMGRNVQNALESKGGKIGYAYDLLDGAVDNLQRFVNIMNEVDEKRRGDIQPRLNAERMRDGKEKEMVKNCDRKIIIWNHPTAYNSQVDYLRTEDMVVSTRKDELLHKSVVRAAQQMRDYTIEVRDEVGRWIQLLATGDPATDITGITRSLEKNLAEVQATAEKDAALQAVQTTIPGQMYPEDKAELDRLMRAVNWSFNDVTDSFSLALSFTPKDEPQTIFERPTGRERPEVRGHLTQRNLDTMLGYARKRFSEMPSDVRVADRLAEEFANNASAFAQDLGEKSYPLFEAQPAEQGGPAKWAQLIRLMDPGDTAFGPATRKFVDDVQTELRTKAGVDPVNRDQDKLVQVVGSADTHKCTVVYTEDLYEVRLFKAWKDCEKAYLENPKLPPHLNHIFPAEANAARYEVMLSKKRRLQYKVFHPWVVMLLEDAQKARQFFQCWALGYIAMRDDGVDLWYELQLPSFDRPYMLTPRAKTKPSMFQVMRSFVLVGLDQAPQSNWALDYKEAQEAIDAEERAAGKEGWIGFLSTQKDPANASGVVGKLNTIAHDLQAEVKHGRSLPTDEPANFQEAYVDLANLASLMFEERIEQKERSSK